MHQSVHFFPNFQSFHTCSLFTVMNDQRQLFQRQGLPLLGRKNTKSGAEGKNGLFHPNNLGKIFIPFKTG
jgi:hypothetical protein